MLIDAGDTTKGKAVVEALKRNNVQQLDYFIATHPHPDHIGGATEVFKAVKVLNVIDNGQPPSVPPQPAARQSKRLPRQQANSRHANRRQPDLPLRLRSFTTTTKQQ